MAAVTISLARKPRLKFEHKSAWLWLAVVCVLVLYPIIRIVMGSFELEAPGQALSYSIKPWQSALADPQLLTSLRNTFVLTVTRLAIGFPIAIFIAWILARTDIAGSRWLEFMFWVAFFLPQLPVTLGWIMLLDPSYGLLNEAIAALTGAKGMFNIYSFGGLVWAYLATGGIASKVMFLTPALRNLDASLEEASRVHGSSTLGTFFRVVLPLMTPVLLMVLLLSLIYSLQTFQVELILGFPIRYFVFSTQIYLLLQQQPPAYSEAAALSTAMLVLMIPVIGFQRWWTSRRSYTTITAHFKAHKLSLRRWRTPLFAFVLAVVIITTLLPFCFLLLGSFMQLFGFFNAPNPWTIGNWALVLADPIFVRSILNTLVLGAGTSFLALVVCTSIAYIIMRIKFPGDSLLDFMSWLPLTIPGIILGVGLLELFLETPILRPLYGTMYLLILATMIGAMTPAVQIIKGNLAQVGVELEEAARLAGGNILQMFRHVVLPIMGPTLVVAGAVSFLAAVGNVSTVVLLSDSATRPLSLLQLDYMVDGRYESAAVIGVVLVLVTSGAALLARLFGLRVGLAQ